MITMEIRIKTMLKPINDIDNHIKIEFSSESHPLDVESSKIAKVVKWSVSPHKSVSPSVSFSETQESSHSQFLLLYI